MTIYRAQLYRNLGIHFAYETAYLPIGGLPLLCINFHQ